MSTSNSSEHGLAAPKRPASRRHKEIAILESYPLREHWKAPKTAYFGGLHRALFSIMCMASFGHTNLEHAWAAIRLEEKWDDGTVWEDGVRKMCERLNNMLLVAGLLLASAAALITTTPPRQEIADYTLRGPYVCLLGSFGLLIGGIIVGSTTVVIISKCNSDWMDKVMCADRFHVYCTLILLSYPFFSVGIATLLLAFGVLSSVWSATDSRVQGASVFILLLPLSMAVIFVLSCVIAPKPSPNRNGDNGRRGNYKSIPDRTSDTNYGIQIP